MNLTLFISGRYLGRRSGRGFASVVTTVSFLGIVLGVVALLVVVSVMNGFDRELKSRSLGAVPHVVVHAAEGDNLQIDLSDPAIRAITPFQEANVLVASARGSQLIAVYGLQPGLEADASRLPEAMDKRVFTALTPGGNNLILGESVARRLGLRPGDDVNVLLPVPSASGRTLRPKLARATFVGSFSLGSELDYQLGLMHLEDLTPLIDQPHGFRITLDDIYDAPKLSMLLRQAGYRVEDWTGRYGDFFATVQMEKIMMFIVLTFVIAVASFSIVAGLSMLVDAKRREIAVLRTMGMPEPEVLKLFFLQGCVITLVGVGVGLLVGVPLSFYVPEVMGVVESFLGFSIVEGTYFDRIPTDPRLADIVVITFVTTSIGALATLQPARRAARLSPVQVLRYE